LTSGEDKTIHRNIEFIGNPNPCFSLRNVKVAPVDYNAVLILEILAHVEFAILSGPKIVLIHPAPILRNVIVSTDLFFAKLTGRHWTSLLEKVLLPDPGKPTKTRTRGVIIWKCKERVKGKKGPLWKKNRINVSSVGI
jgi:hypothetical protein